MAEIVLDRVSKVFADGTCPLQETSFSIADGEFFILVGPSGCGKSTLLNMIVGLESITRGEIRVDGWRVNELDPKDRNMAMVFQSYAIYPHMSVRENIAFPLRLAKLDKMEIRRRVEQAAATLELTELLERKPASLSGGQRQRVAMGRALVREPKAFLLDEPLSNLDARLRVQMRNEIARLQRKLGSTMIYVTHDQTEAMTLGDRVAVLNHGRIQQIGSPQSLYRQPANLFVAEFIGSPAMNLLPGFVNDRHLSLPIGEMSLSDTQRQILPSDCQRVVVGFRPEHLSLVESDSRPADGLILNAQVDIVEWLGAESYVYFDTPWPKGWPKAQWPEALIQRLRQHSRLPVVARLAATQTINKNQKLSLLLKTQDICLFDAKSGRAYRLED